MRKMFKAMVGLSMSVPALAAKQASSFVRSGGDSGPIGEDLEKIRSAVEDRLDGTAKTVVKAVGALAGGAEDQPTDALEPKKRPVDTGALEVETFVAVGDALLAGFGDFSLAEVAQVESAAAHLARQLDTAFPQTLIESPGLGNPHGFAELPVQVPALMQTTSVIDFRERPVPHDLTIPGFTVADALALRPTQPLVHQDDTKQTMANLVLGLEELVEGKTRKHATMVETAIDRSPNLLLVSIGYEEMLAAAIAGSVDAAPDQGSFRRDFGKMLAALAETGARMVVTSIPDPLHTAFFTDFETCGDILRVEAEVLEKGFGLQTDALVTVPGLLEMGYRLLSNQVETLGEEFILGPEKAKALQDRLSELNEIVTELAADNHAELVDLAAIFEEWNRRGAAVGGRRLTADFLGGLFQLNGSIPGATGQALIANKIIAQLNQRFGAQIPGVALPAVLRRDPAADCRQAQGPKGALGDYTAGTPLEDPTDVAKKPAAEAKNKSRKKKARSRKGGNLKLPPNRIQKLRISKEASYFGDAIRATNLRDRDEWMFGGGRELLFGGLAMVDSHIDGEVTIEFSEPVDGMTTFTVRHGKLVGDDGCLAAPTFFKLPALRNQVVDDSEMVSTGRLNLETGEVDELDIAVRFGNTALISLVRVNPLLPDIPIQFPGMYGSAWAKFEQRDDGLLDYTFYGSTFLPLGGEIEGDGVRFPLPIASPTLEFASIPAPGTSLHPHLFVTTKDPEPADPAEVPEIPTNCIREYTIHTHNTAFGDKFTLDSPELRGDPTGRSQLLGRVQVQFGHPSGDSVPVAISCLNPGGMLEKPTPSPLADDFPGRLAPAPIGHNEFLRFATRTYYLDALTCIDDPFDVSVGNVSMKTGRFLGDLLHRALIGQNLFYALLRVEPRTPKSSFFFRGPARFQKGRDERTVFRFEGQVTVVYPGGFLFPSPDMAEGVVVETDSVLDPFYWIQAMDHDSDCDAEMKGSASKLVASTNEVFSYKYDIKGGAGARKPKFEYINHSVDGTFKLQSLSWVSFTNSMNGEGEGPFDCLSFTGYGTWSRDPSGELHVCCVQISECSETPYVSIQIGGGRVSNVNTKPTEIDEVRP